ncbi:MAG: glycosyltransferase family 39 protein [Anaerolineales bacterium]
MFGLTLFLSILLRIFPGILTSFPINDGGLFVVMARDLRFNGFALPSFTTYNNFNIPFAYPPLGFYITGFLSALGIPELAIAHWLPICISCLSVIVVFFLYNAILKDRARAAVATLLFAMIPSSYDMQVMGGGLTRTFGILFFGLATYAVYKLFETSSWKVALLAMLFCSLAVLSHPEVILATASGCALIWIFYGRSWKKSLLAAAVAGGTLALTAPWWGTVLAQHGLAPFSSALNTGAYQGLPFNALYEGFLAPLSLFSLFGLLRLGGIVWCLWKKQFFLVTWVLLPYFVEPRSAPEIAAFPAAMLMALCLADVLPALVEWVRKALKKQTAQKDFTQTPWLSAVLLVFMLGLFIASALHDFSLANTTLEPPEPQALMDWTRNNTPQDSQFLILTGVSGVQTDPIQEWFPALTGRRAQTASQGLEWRLGTAFFTRVDQLIALQKCEDVVCVENWSAETGLGFTHLVVETSALTQGLVDSLSGDKGYSLIYQNAKYLIYKPSR